MRSHIYIRNLTLFLLVLWLWIIPGYYSCRRPIDNYVVNIFEINRVSYEICLFSCANVLINDDPESYLVTYMRHEVNIERSAICKLGYTGYYKFFCTCRRKWVVFPRRSKVRSRNYILLRVFKRMFSHYVIALLLT